MRRARRRAEVFGLSFMDCICCGFGATILLYMILNSDQDRRARDALTPARSETNLLEQQVLEGQANLVELRNTLEQVRDEDATAYARRLSRGDRGPFPSRGSHEDQAAPSR